MKKPEISIEIISDVVCPWCFIGKRRIEKAMEMLKADYDFNVSYSPFELNPTTPAEGVDQQSYLTKKFGGEERYRQITSHVTSIAAQEGLAFDFSKQKVSPNTREAHRLIWYAKQEGKQAEINELLMKAYFEEGIDLSKEKNLLMIAAKGGLDPKKTESFLKSDAGKAEVHEKEQINVSRGISGVPFFLVDGKYGISGAQSTDTFVNIFQKIGRAASAAVVQP